MTQYSKLNFTNGSPPALNAESLNHIEEGIAGATTAIINLEKEIKTKLSTVAGAVKSTNIADGAVTAGKISDNAVLPNNIVAGAISKDKLSKSFQQEINGKANSATTLAGYGITDAYTKEETDAALSGKADKATTIAGYGIRQYSFLYDAYGRIFSTTLDRQITSQSFANQVNTANRYYVWLASDVTSISSDALQNIDNIIKIQCENSEENITFPSEYDGVNKSFGKSTLSDFYRLNSLAKLYNEKADKSTMQNLLGKKYDASNIEYGSGTLTPGSTTANKVSSSDFVYQKIGKSVMLNVNIVLNNSAASKIIFSGLPFVSSNFGDVYEYCISSTGTIFEAIIYASKSQIMFKPKDTEDFIPGESITFAIQYFVS